MSAEELALLRRRGCLVVRGHFDREQALGWDRDIVDYVEGNRFFENYRGPGDDFFGSVGSKPEIYPIYWSPAQMQARQERTDGEGPGLPQQPVEARVRGRAVVRPEPGLAVPGPHPPPSGGRRLGRSGHPPRPGHARPVDDRGLPEGVPAPLRRDGRAVRPLGRGPPYGRTAVPRHDHVFGVPHLPGLDRAVRHGARPGCSAHRADPRGDGLPDAAPAAGRRARRRHVRRDGQPGLPGEREVAPAAHGGRRRHPGRQGRRLRLVALRHDPQRRRRSRTSRAGATSCTSPPPLGARATRRYAADVREAFRTGSSPSDFPAEHYERTWPDRFPPTTSTTPAAAASASPERLSAPGRHGSRGRTGARSLRRGRLHPLGGERIAKLSS